MSLSIHYFRESEMARLTRVCPVGVPQHIIQRGNNRQVSDQARLLTVIYTLRDDSIRIISARKSTTKEANNYA